MIIKKEENVSNEFKSLSQFNWNFYPIHKEKSYTFKKYIQLHISSLTLQLFGNTFSPISVTLFGIVIFVSDLHPQKESQLTFVTTFGIVIFVSDEHPEKAKVPILVKFCMAL